jgi:aryl-alcohol dehydrogenase-like predicted oxidoreductase
MLFTSNVIPLIRALGSSLFSPGLSPRSVDPSRMSACWRMVFGFASHQHTAVSGRNDADHARPRPNDLASGTLGRQAAGCDLRLEKGRTRTPSRPVCVAFAAYSARLPKYNAAFVHDIGKSLERFHAEKMGVRRLGSHGPQISVIGYGGWEAGSPEWGTSPSDADVVAAMRAGFDAGITWVDTAEVYGHGRSEELIGRAVQGRRHIMAFTKVASAPRGSGYDPKAIRRAAERSLRRLGREVIDLYQLHWLDEKDASLEETWAAMAALVDAGLVRWIGVSNFTSHEISRCERIRHVDSLQPHLSMLWQERLPLLSFCARNGTGVIAYGPLAFGLLTGNVTRETTFAEDDWRSGTRGIRAYSQLFAPGRLEANLKVVDALMPVAGRLQISLARLALAWVLHQPGLSGAIVGSRSAQHVRENASASAVNLSPSDLAEIGSIISNRGEVVGGA